MESQGQSEGRMKSGYNQIALYKCITFLKNERK